MKSRVTLSFVFAIIFLFTISGYARTSESNISDANNTGPKVGLVLSGGGAKGLSHISLIRILEEVNMPIDFIGGTSMGSIVGALYSIGYTAREIEEIIVNEDWTALLNDVVHRRYIPIEEKMWDAKFMLSLPVTSRGINLPSGLITGQEISKLFSRLTIPVHGYASYYDFPIPFVAIATDLETGNAIVMRDGNLAESIRASMSLPTIFAPSIVEGRVAIDGGVARNLPVVDVLEMGADYVIGVNVSTGGIGPDTLNTILQVLSQTVFYHIIETTQNQAKLVDFFINPDLDIGMMSFDSVKEVIQLADEAMEEFRPQLQQIADSINALRSNPGQRHRFFPERQELIKIDRIEFENVVNTDKKILLAELSIEPNTSVSPKEIDLAIDRIYSLKFFNKVTYSIKNEDDQTTLVIKLFEKTHDVFQVGLRYDNRTRSSLLFNYTFRHRERSTSTYRLNLRLGEEPAFDSQYFHYLGFRPKLGVNIKIGGARHKDELFVGSSAISSLETESAYAEIWAGPVVSSVLILGAGLKEEFYRVARVIGAQYFGDDWRLNHNFFAFIWLDTKDDAFFAHKGQMFRADYKQGLYGYGDYTIFNEYKFRWENYIPLSQNTTGLIHLASGVTTGDTPVHYRQVMGGFSEFVGFRRDELSDEWISSAQVGLQYRLTSTRYIILRGNAGRISPFQNMQFDDYPVLVGWGVTGAVNTLVGPIQLTFSGSKRHPILYDIQIGFDF
jgi:NTE family protein